MPTPNHSNPKSPGKRQWFKRRNVKREHKRRKEANDLEFIKNFKKGQAKT